jgi:hypothetical protein
MYTTQKELRIERLGHKIGNYEGAMSDDAAATLRQTFMNLSSKDKWSVIGVCGEGSLKKIGLRIK